MHSYLAQCVEGDMILWPYSDWLRKKKIYHARLTTFALTVTPDSWVIVPLGTPKEKKKKRTMCS